MFIDLALTGSSLRSRVPVPARSSSSSFGAIVSRSEPASWMISSLLRKLAPMTSVLWPNFL